MNIELLSQLDLEPATRTAFDELLPQMSSQWDVAHTPTGKTKRTMLQAYHNATETIATATITPLNFNGEEDIRDRASVVPAPTGAVHSKTVTPSRFVVPSKALAGMLRIRARVTFEANATGARAVFLYRNGVAYKSGQIVASAGAGVGTQVEANWVVPCDVGDVFVIAAYQTSGGNLAVGSTDPVFYNAVDLEFI